MSDALDKLIGSFQPTTPTEQAANKSVLERLWDSFASKPSPSPQKQPTANDQGLGKGLTLDNVFEGLKQAESRGIHIDPKTGGLLRSSAGAEGITQLMPSTAKKPGFGIEPAKDKSEEEYSRVGKEYLSALHNKYGDWEMALAAYNAGPKNVDTAKGKAERFGGDWKDYLPKKEETIPYLNKILNRKK